MLRSLIGVCVYVGGFFCLTCRDKGMPGGCEECGEESSAE